MNTIQFLNLLIIAPDMIHTSTTEPVHSCQYSNRGYTGKRPGGSNISPHFALLADETWSEDRPSVLSSVARYIPACFMNWISDFLTLNSKTSFTRNIKLSLTIHCTTQLLTMTTHVQSVLHEKQDQHSVLNTPPPPKNSTIHLYYSNSSQHSTWTANFLVCHHLYICNAQVEGPSWMHSAKPETDDNVQSLVEQHLLQ
jgi:hypothetical protein